MSEPAQYQLVLTAQQMTDLFSALDDASQFDLAHRGDAKIYQALTQEINRQCKEQEGEQKREEAGR